MPRYVVKPVPDRDEYIVWSTIVDGITWWGSSEVLMNENPDVTQNRIDVADMFGTSAIHGFYGYDVDEFIVQNLDELHDETPWIKVLRKDLYAFACGPREVSESLSEPYNRYDD